MKRIGVLGAGTWGATLARLLANKGESVTLWSALPQEVAVLNETRIHPKLPDLKIPESIIITDDLAAVCSGQEAIVFATPSVFIRDTARKASSYISAAQRVVSVAKGLEPGTLMTMTQVIGEELGGRRDIVALSGPTHAEEVALDMPTMIVSACADMEAAKAIQELFSTDFLRVYTNADVDGVELCGAVKNVMALAAGMAVGLGYGDNTKAALITRGIVELTRLGEAVGCQPQTFGGLAGIGDLIVTATSLHSRNNRAGILIGQGMSAADAVREIGMVVEGLNALEGALALSRKHAVEMPIVEAVDLIVNHGASPRDVVNRLMTRQKKDEFGG